MAKKLRISNCISVSTVEDGERGKTGRMYYYAGAYNAADNTQTFIVSDTQTPFFRYGVQHYVFVPPVNGTFTMKQMHDTYGDPGNSQAEWQLMQDNFKYLITEAVFGDFSKFGSAIISGDWMMSTNGLIYDTSGAAHVIDATHTWNDGTTTFDTDNAYTLFASDSPCESKSGVNNFVPVYAIDLKTGAGHFGGGKILFNADGSGQLAGGNVSWDAQGNAEFAGELKGVTGSFIELECKGGSTSNGKIKFAIDGTITVTGDLYGNGSKDGRSLRWYASDFWCRGVFGAAHYATLKVQGQYGYYYVNGALSTPTQIQFGTGTDSRGNTYYNIDCYPGGQDIPMVVGCAITTVVFALSGNETLRYNLQMEETQRLKLINVSKTKSVYIYSNGKEVELKAREMQEAVFVPLAFFAINYDESLKPTGLGAGIMLGGYNQNDTW